MLTEKRKADRLTMAAKLETLITECGATFERIEPAPLSPRAIWLEVKAARGLCVTVDLDGDSWQPDIHVLSWHMDFETDACLSDRFGRLGSLNQHHWRKATYCAEGFESLCAALRYGLTLARDGTAFDPEREAAAIAADGTWQARKAAFDAGMAEWKANRAESVS